MQHKAIVNGRVVCPADQAEGQYNLRAAFPHYPQQREGWLEKGKPLKQEFSPILDLAYGDQPLQTLDLYKSSEANKPLFIFVHGGYWQGGDKADVSFLARPFIEAGINVALPNYSLAPDARIEEMVAEMRAMLAWLQNRASEYHYNADAISLMGHSAGGHLVSTLAADAAQGLDGLNPVRQVFSVSGVHDLPPLLPSSVNNALGLDQERAEALSPVTMPAPEATEVYTIVGDLETEQCHAQSLLLHEAWPMVKAHYEVEASDHFTILDVLADPKSSHAQRLVAAIQALSS